MKSRSLTILQPFNKGEKDEFFQHFVNICDNSKLNIFLGNSSSSKSDTAEKSSQTSKIKERCYTNTTFRQNKYWIMKCWELAIIDSNYSWAMHLQTVKKKETSLFISIQIIVQKWSWYHSSWIIVYFSLML